MNRAAPSPSAATSTRPYDLGKARYDAFVANAPAPEEFPSWEAISNDERQAWMNDAISAPAAAVGGSGVDDGSRYQLGTDGRLTPAAPVGGFVVAWRVRWGGSNHFGAWNDGPCTDEQVADLKAHGIEDVQRAYSSPAAQPSAKDGAKVGGLLQVSAPTGQPARAWTERERHDCKEAMRKIVEREATTATTVETDDRYKRMYLNLVEAFNEYAQPWMREDGDGGFAGTLARMAEAATTAEGLVDDAMLCDEFQPKEVRGWQRGKSFWVIEKFNDGHGGQYWAGGTYWNYTTDVNKAVQFCRESDALVCPDCCKKLEGTSDEPES